MSPHEHEHSRDELITLVEKESQLLLGVSWAQANSMLDSGALAGTAAEAEVRMLKFLIDD